MLAIGERAVRGPVRLGRRTKELVPFLRPGDIPLLDHEDLDEVAARALLERGVGAVLDARPALTGRYRNAGPHLLVAAGVPVLDSLGQEAFSALRDGDRVEVRGSMVLKDGAVVARGRRLTPQLVQSLLAAADPGGDGWQRFLENTLDYARREKDFFLAPLPLPPLRAPRRRQAVVVVRGPGYREDLRALRPYIRAERPLLVAVDGGADALLECGLKPHLIVGDMDSVSEGALGCGAELVVHAYPDGTSPGQERLRRRGREGHLLPAPGTSEDLALLLAYELGAELIVAVGTHRGYEDFMDKGRSGMASTFLVRLKIGPRLLDARGLSLLYRPPRPAYLLALCAAALVPAAAAVLLSPAVGGLFRLWVIHLRVTAGL